MFNEGYRQLMELFGQTALWHPAIHTALIIGSRAREDHPADEWFDKDQRSVISNEALLLRVAAWLDIFRGNRDSP